MSRDVPEVQRNAGSSSPPSPDADPARRKDNFALVPAKGLEFWLARLFLTACATTLCFKLRPFGLGGLEAASVGFLLGLGILVAELRLRQTETRGLLGGMLGTLLGIFAALLVTLVVSRTNQPEPTKTFLEYAALFAFGYLGLVLGSERGGAMNPGSLNATKPEEANTPGRIKLLDTSVLIDGRIADICETHFLDGVLAVPQFVLHELHLVADSADALKRQRGRRGLEVLARMQKLPQVEVRILDGEATQPGDVDHKLVELARRIGAKIVTNDFNLNKVATVQGLAVLNVNQLANALKPVVLPGEPMRVLILREGKEPNQGVAFLDDGTMVVVDGARRLINKSVDILVTSVHQTTAGKMIFGRVDDRADVSSSAPAARQAAAAGAGRGEISGDPRNDASGRGGNGSRLPAARPFERSPRDIYPETDAD
jgi:uncharacterized protein YacL